MPLRPSLRLGTISINTENNQTEKAVVLTLSSKCPLLNTLGVDTIAKQTKLLDFVNAYNFDILLITETCWNENMRCSLFELFKTIARFDRKNGLRGGVAISRITCKIPAETMNSDDFNFAVDVRIHLSGDPALSFFFCLSTVL